MKILHLSSEYPPQKVYGLGRFVHDISVESARLGHEVHVITNRMGGKDVDICDKGVYVHRVHFPPPKPPDATTTVIQFNTQVIERAVPLVREIRPDVVNTHDWLTFLAGRAVNRIFAIPHVLTIHDTMVGKRFGKLNNPQRLAANIELYGCADADLVICCSEFIKRELISSYRAQADRITVIPCAVNEASFAIDSDRFLLDSFRSALADPHELIITYVGRLDEEKGLDVLVNAIPRIIEKHSAVKFIFAGKGVMGDSIRDWTEKAGLSSRVIMAGYVRGTTLAHLYKVSDIQVVPSSYEPFGIVALEGMVNGVPVVVADSGGLAEIVDHGETGIKFEVGNVDSLSAALESLIANSAMRERIRTAGREKALNTYNWTRIAKLTVAAFERAKTMDSSPPSKISIASEPQHLAIDCVAIGPGMTGIGRYADGVIANLPECLPQFRLTLLATPANEQYLREKYPQHTILATGPELAHRFPERQKALDGVLQKIHADCYFGSMYDAPWSNTVPSITAIYDLSFLKYPDMLSTELTQYTINSARHAVATSRHVITISQTIRREILNHYQIPIGKIALAPPGIDDCLHYTPSPELEEHLRCKYSIRSPFLLAVNLTNSRKNAKNLFQALKILSETKDDLSFVVAGGWDLKEANVWRQAYQAGIDEKLVVTGYLSREELLSLFVMAEVFCMPSLDEGFGMPVAEAMALSTPVVTSNRGALRELAEGCAELVDPESAESIASGIRRVLDSPQLTNLAKGRERARQFTWKATAEKIASVIENLRKPLHAHSV